MRRKMISILLVITLMTTLFPSVIFGAGAGAEKEHWGFKAMQQWADNGLLSGYPDGTLRPDGTLTRAEFAKMLHSIFNFQAVNKVLMNDVALTAWYSSAVNDVIGAGIMNGYPDGSFKPNASLTRQDAAKVIVDAFQLTHYAAGYSDAVAAFHDYDQVSSYAYAAMNTLVNRGIMKGYRNDTLRPQHTITRAEVIALLSQLVGAVISTEGEYKGAQQNGNLIVNTPDVTLEDYTVIGDVYLTAGIGEGDAAIKKSDITGTLFINGGGSNSIYIEQSSVNDIVVDKQNGIVRVVISGDSTIEEITINSQTIIVIEKGAKVGRLILTETAKGSELIMEGNIGEIINRAGIHIPDKPADPDEPGSSNGPSTPTPKPVADKWRLVWSDEFDGSGDNLDSNGLDLDKWGYQHGTGSQYGLVGWGNNEEQYYRPDNVAVEDGMLKITAKQESYEGMNYTSGRIYTEPNYSKTYGKFEARMKLPAGDGLWPAFWMMPQDSEYGTWAASGEIDIMEARGRILDHVGGAIHYGKNAPNNKLLSKDYQFAEGENITDFHVYGLEWEPGELRWYVDGELYQKINNWDSWGLGQPAKYAFPAPFDKPFHMIINLAVGGHFDGGIVPKESEVPAEMLVDYVRVYELDNRPYRKVTEPAVVAEPISSPYKEAIAGNYVYDTLYEQPITTISKDADEMDQQYWNFVHLPSFNGAGTIEIEQIEQTPFAKMNITAAGNENHSVQLIQHVTVGKGRWYKLSFDAKSSSNRNISVKIGGGESRGWSVYSDNLTASLTDEVKSYEMSFLMAAETDKLARLEFNVGNNLLPVWIGNVQLVEIDAIDPYHEDADKEPLNNGNHIYNGSFDLGYIHRMTYWTFQQQDAKATASVDADARELYVNIATPGKQPENISLTQKGIQLIPGNEYRLSFKARASAERSIAVDLLKQDGTSYGLTEQVQLTEEMESYQVTFNVTEVTESSGQLVFLLGEETGNVYIDDIELYRITDNNIGGLPLELQFPLKNGDFSNGDTGWSAHVQGSYDGWDPITAMNIVNAEAQFDIRDIGNQPWDVMLMQENLELKRNEVYTLELDMKATENRDVEIVVEDGNYERYLSERVAVTTDWQTYRYEIPMNKDAVVAFKLLLGKLDTSMSMGSHIVSIDNVRLELKDARKGAFLAVNGYFDQQLEGWNEHVQGVYDGPSVASFSAVDHVLHANITHSGINPWDIVISQDAVNLKKGETYIVSFLAKASEAKTIDVVVENGSYFRYLNENVELTDGVESYSFEFTMPSDDATSLKFLFGKQAGDAFVSYDAYIDNVRFELKDAQIVIGENVRTDHQIVD